MARTRIGSTFHKVALCEVHRARLLRRGEAMLGDSGETLTELVAATAAGLEYERQGAE